MLFSKKLIFLFNFFLVFLNNFDILLSKIKFNK
jgi:hypothetical protein